MSSEVRPNTTADIGTTNPSAGEPLTTPTDAGFHVVIPLYGLTGYRFYLIHITAVVCMVVSLIFSVGLARHILKKPIPKNPIPVRLAFYLAICDIGFYGSHIADHCYSLAHKRLTPGKGCIIEAALLYQFGMSQCMVVFLTAVNGFVQIGLEKKINWGLRDWRLLLIAFGAPFVIVVIGLALGYLGPEDMMCGIAMGKPMGPTFSIIGTTSNLVTLTTCLVCYLGVWIKIKHVSGQVGLGNNSPVTKYRRTALILFVFIVSYVLQWWAYFIFRVRAMFGNPKIGIRFCCVLFANLGGAFNFFAYTHIRRKLTKVQPDEKPNLNKFNGSARQVNNHLHANHDVPGTSLNAICNPRPPNVNNTEILRTAVINM